jgi:hypothetical protein
MIFYWFVLLLKIFWTNHVCHIPGSDNKNHRAIDKESTLKSIDRVEKSPF